MKRLNNMATITIPRDFPSKENLVAVPRKLYEEFLAWQRRFKSTRTFKPTATEKKSLVRARKNMQRGDYLTSDDLRYELGAGR